MTDTHHAVAPTITDPSMLGGKSKKNTAEELLKEMQGNTTPAEDLLKPSETKTAEELAQKTKSEGMSTTIIIIFTLIVIALVCLILWMVLKSSKKSNDELAMQQVLGIQCDNEQQKTLPNGMTPQQMQQLQMQQQMQIQRMQQMRLKQMQHARMVEEMRRNSKTNNTRLETIEEEPEQKAPRRKDAKDSVNKSVNKSVNDSVNDSVDSILTATNELIYNHTDNTCENTKNDELDEQFVVTNDDRERLRLYAMEQLVESDDEDS